MFQAIIAILILFSAAATDTDESFGFLPIREDATMFFWLMRAGNQTHDHSSFPLVIYLSGGPGEGSSGFANMLEIGPVDVDGRTRNSTWLKHANLLFFDNPVGCGYSYVREGGHYARNNSMIASDFISALQMFLTKHPEFRKIPSLMFGESYGGKMAATIAREINEQVRSGEMLFNLKAVALGDAWIDPMQTMKSWPDYLFGLSLVDDDEKRLLGQLISDVEQTLASGDGVGATRQWRQVEDQISSMTFGLDLEGVTDYSFIDVLAKPLTVRMNDRDMRSRLRIPDNVTWKRKATVADHLQDDYLTSTTHEVDYLLSRTNIQVIVYGGQFDGEVPMIATEGWINRLTWSGKDRLKSIQKNVLVTADDGTPLVFAKKSDSLSLYFMLAAGHFVPIDQPDASVKLLQHVLSLLEH